MLLSCYNCCRKHLGTAHSFFQKASSGEGSYNFWLGIGQLILAAEEIRRDDLDIFTDIISEKILMLERFKKYPVEIIDICSQLGAANGMIVEYSTGRYLSHFWYTIGKMHNLEFINNKKYSSIIKIIDNERTKMINDSKYITDFISLICVVWNDYDDYNFIIDQNYWTNFDTLINKITNKVINKNKRKNYGTKNRTNKHNKK